MRIWLLPCRRWIKEVFIFVSDTSQMYDCGIDVVCSGQVLIEGSVVYGYSCHPSSLSYNPAPGCSYQSTREIDLIFVSRVSQLSMSARTEIVLSTQF